MSGRAGPARLQSAYEEGGLSGLAQTLTGYVRWRLQGSPVEIPEPLEERLERADAAAVVVLMRDYYQAASPSQNELLSVILPTRDRHHRLARAIGSVSSQEYTNWELVVVNDSTVPLPGSVIPDDPRIVVIQGESKGVAAARNLGLDAAKGELIGFLDDDNLMDSLWLKALALTRQQEPETDVFVGAQLVTPDPGEAHRHTLRIPARFDWDQLTEANYIDMGMLAHRPNPSLRFDESLPSLVDWDYVVRLTADARTSLVPAVSGLYLTDSDRRISYTDRQGLVREVKERFAAMKHSRTSIAETELWRPDVDALVLLARRLGRMHDRKPSVGVLTDTALTSSVLKTLTDADVAVAGTDEPVDILFIETLPNESDWNLLEKDGFLMGLNAHRVDYSKLGLQHARPIGDHMWIGSRVEFDPEELFDGGTLVKFGVPREY